MFVCFESLVSYCLGLFPRGGGLPRRTASYLTIGENGIGKTRLVIVRELNVTVNSSFITARIRITI